MIGGKKPRKIPTIFGPHRPVSKHSIPYMLRDCLWLLADQRASLRAFGFAERKRLRRFITYQCVLDFVQAAIATVFGEVFDFEISFARSLNRTRQYVAYFISRSIDVGTNNQQTSQM